MVHYRYGKEICSRGLYIGFKSEQQKDFFTLVHPRKEDQFFSQEDDLREAMNEQFEEDREEAKVMLEYMAEEDLRKDLQDYAGTTISKVQIRALARALAAKGWRKA